MMMFRSLFFFQGMEYGNSRHDILNWINTNTMTSFLKLIKLKMKLIIDVDKLCLHGLTKVQILKFICWHENISQNVYQQWKKK